MFQRTKRLTHVAEFAKRRVQLLGLRWAGRCLLRRMPAPAPEVQDDEQSGDDKQGDEGVCHGGQEEETGAVTVARRGSHVSRNPRVRGDRSRASGSLQGHRRTLADRLNDRLIGSGFQWAKPDEQRGRRARNAQCKCRHRYRNPSAALLRGRQKGAEW